MKQVELELLLLVVLCFLLLMQAPLLLRFPLLPAKLAQAVLLLLSAAAAAEVTGCKDSTAAPPAELPPWALQPRHRQGNGTSIHHTLSQISIYYVSKLAC
jgi:hypothetical protein